MTAGISLIPGKTGAHRAPLQLLRLDRAHEDSPFPQPFCRSFRRHPDVEVIVVMLPAKPVQAFVAPAVYQDFRSKRVSARARHDTVVRVRTAGRHMPGR